MGMRGVPELDDAANTHLEAAFFPLLWDLNSPEGYNISINSLKKSFPVKARIIFSGMSMENIYIYIYPFKIFSLHM